MKTKNLKEIVLESILTFGPLAIPEILYLLRNHLEWVIRLRFNEFSNLSHKKIFSIIKKLQEKKKLRDYICDSGYRKRFGISKIPISVNYPLRLKLVVNLEKCPICLSWVIIYFDKKKHLFPFFCENRKKENCSELKFYNHNEKIYLIYKNLFLGIFDDGKLRLPKRDFIAKKPEIFIAMDLVNNKKNSIIKNKIKLHLKEDLI